jgi:adenine-specific DNA-methyltransferase
MLKMIIGASSQPDDIVLDAFCGSGTTLVAAEELGRRWIGIDSSPSSIKTTVKRLLKTQSNRLFKLFQTMS